MSYIHQLLLACPLVFLAGFVDSISGGGGLISLPAYYLVGLPPRVALGTNKMGAIMGAATASAQYLKKKCVWLQVLPFSIAAALIGSYIGAQLTLFINERYLKYIMVVLVPVLAVFTIFKKGFLTEQAKRLTLQKARPLCALFSFIIGMYDGFFGPGAGMFFTMAFVGVVGMDVVTACGTTKVVNLATNLAAVCSFLFSGNIIFGLAIPCGLCNIVGSYIGSRLAIRKGVTVVKPVMLVVVVLLMLSIIKDLIAPLV